MSEGESLGGFDYVNTDDTLVSTRKIVCMKRRGGGRPGDEAKAFPKASVDKISDLTKRLSRSFPLFIVHTTHADPAFNTS